MTEPEEPTMADVQPIRPEIEVPIEAYEQDECLPQEENFTDVGYGRRFVALHRGSVRWEIQGQRWLRWTGASWQPDEQGWATEQMKEIARLLMERSYDAPQGQQAVLQKAALRLEARGAISAALEMARSEPGVPLDRNDLDADPWLLACPNITIDLRTGQPRPPRREDLCSFTCSINPNATVQTPFYDTFIAKISAQDPQWVKILHKIIGYCLTGLTSERCLFLFYGPKGRNGKSTLLRLITRILGQYAARIPTETIVEKKGQHAARGADASPDLMLLRGRRLVFASETKRDQRWNVGLIKDITGGDAITARGLHESFTEFRPKCKLVLQSNMRPLVDSMDEATWSRLRLLPFDYQFTSEELLPDIEVDRLLWAEAPGILARWAAGTQAWMEDGLGNSERTRCTLDEYREENDILGRYLEDRVARDEFGWVQSSTLYTDYKKWAQDEGHNPWSSSSFHREMKQRGFCDRRQPGSGLRGWQGIALRGL
jgi:putative DNA primase/helicase